MDECEALLIMVAGDFKCLGSVPHLKNKNKIVCDFLQMSLGIFILDRRFSKGFILTIKMERDTDAQLHEIQNWVHNLICYRLLFSRRNTWIS